MSKRLRSFMVAVMMAGVSLSAAACGEGGTDSVKGEKTFRVAMAKADITPKKSVYLEGYEGHGDASFAIYPDNFTSDLMARILVVDNGDDRLVFLNLELAISDVDFHVRSVSKSLIERIASACHTATDNVLLSNTHNHHAPMTLSEPQEDNIAAAAEEAYKNLVPASIGINTVNTAFGISRGSNYTMDEKKPYDNVMTVIRFEDAKSKKPIGLVYSVPIHNTMFGNGPGLKVTHSKLSCEFTGYASRFIEDEMKGQNPRFTAMHINGFYGNSGPLYNGVYYAKSVEELQEAGKHFGEEILAAYEKAQPGPAYGSISAELLEDGLLTNQENRDFALYFGNYQEMPFVISMGSFGDIAFVGVNFEPFSIIGARLKAEAPFGTVLPAGNVNGWRGYIPTKETFASHLISTEAECLPGKTPFTAETEEIFYSKLLDALCKHAGVSLSRVESMPSVPFEKNGAAVYSFDFGRSISVDKLVIDFGQKYRTDCASDFDIRLYDQSGNIVYTRSFEGYSVNYIGMFTENVRFAKAEMVVKGRYLSDDLMGLSPRLYGIVFTPTGEGE